MFQNGSGVCGGLVLLGLHSARRKSPFGRMAFRGTAGLWQLEGSLEQGCAFFGRLGKACKSSQIRPLLGALGWLMAPRLAAFGQETPTSASSAVLLLVCDWSSVSSVV
jgi:hypothetical protein